MVLDREVNFDVQVIASLLVDTQQPKVVAFVNGSFFFKVVALDTQGVVDVFAVFDGVDSTFVVASSIGFCPKDLSPRIEFEHPKVLATLDVFVGEVDVFAVTGHEKRSVRRFQN